MLLVLKPLPLILFTVGKHIRTVAFTLALHILALVNVTVLKNGLSLSIGLAAFYFAGIDSSVIFERIGTYLYSEENVLFTLSKKPLFFPGQWLRLDIRKPE